MNSSRLGTTARHGRETEEEEQQLEEGGLLLTDGGRKQQMMRQSWRCSVSPMRWDWWVRGRKEEIKGKVWEEGGGGDVKSSPETIVSWYLYHLSRCPWCSDASSCYHGVIAGVRDGHFYQDAMQIQSIHHFWHKLTYVSLGCADVSAAQHRHPADTRRNCTLLQIFAHSRFYHNML